MLHDNSGAITRSALTRTTYSTGNHTLLALQHSNSVLLMWMVWALHGKRANCGTEQDHNVYEWLEAGSGSANMIVEHAVIYLNRPDALVPPSWHPILPDRYRTNSKKSSSAFGLHTKTWQVSQLDLVAETKHTRDGFSNCLLADKRSFLFAWTRLLDTGS